MKVNWDSLFLLSIFAVVLAVAQLKFNLDETIVFISCFGMGFFWSKIYKPIIELKGDDGGS